MNFIEQNNSFMKSLHQLFQSQWANPLQVVSPVPTRYSPFSSSTASFISPVKSEHSDQEEPLNLSLKCSDTHNNSSQVSPLINQFNVSPMTMSHIPILIPHMFQTLFAPRPILPNMNKMSSMPGFFPIQLNSPDLSQKQRRKSTPVKIKKSRSFKCNQCRMMFTCLASLSEHTQKNHGGYKCHICDTSFTQRSNLQRHALRHVGFKPYKCGVCSKEYYRKDHLIRHISFNHPIVNPKENIIQRLSSSESLNFIDSQVKSESTIDETPILPPSSTHSSEISIEDANSVGEENIFLASEIAHPDIMDVDILN